MSAPTTVEWLRTAAARVGTGSGRLTMHLARRTVARVRRVYEGLWDWVGQSASGFDKVFRLAVLAVGVLIVRKTGTAIVRWAYERIESGAWGPVLFAAAGVWIVCAYRAGKPGWTPKAPKEKAKPEAEEAAPADESHKAGEAPEGAPVVSLEKPPLPTPVAFVSALSRLGTPHAHLSVLAPELGTTPDLMRQALAGWGIPVEDVRMKGRGTSTGVKGDPFPTLRTPSDGVVDAGQPTNNNDNNTFTTVADEDNPVRTHVVWNTGQTTD